MSLYKLSRVLPVRFTARLYGVRIDGTDIEAGRPGVGNHYRSETHFDAETCTWWQWRDRIWRRRTIRMCMPDAA